MPIYDRSYRRWDGKLRRHAFRGWPIAVIGVQQALKWRGKALGAVAFYGFLMLSFLPFLALLLLNYAYHFPPAFIAENADIMQVLGQLSGYKVVQYYTMVFFSLISLKIFTVVFGSGLIARDRAAMALPLYLSRPLTMFDYIAGKFAIVAFYLGCLTLFPALILYLFDVFATSEDGYFLKSLPTFAAILCHTGSIVLVYSATILGVSSFCRRPMIAGLIWFAALVVLPNVVYVIGLSLKRPALLAVSPMEACNTIAYRMYDLVEVKGLVGGAQAYQNLGLERLAEIPFHWALVSTFAWVVLGLYLVWAFVRRQDVAGDGR